MISLKFVSKSPIANESALVQVMSWHRTGDKPLPEPILTKNYLYRSMDGPSRGQQPNQSVIGCWNLGLLWYIDPGLSLWEFALLGKVLYNIIFHLQKEFLLYNLHVCNLAAIICVEICWLNFPPPPPPPPPPVFFMTINKVTSAIVHGCENITGLNILVGETLSPECQKS